MKTLSNGISIIEKSLAVVLMFSMAVIVTMAVFFRYFLNSPLSWAGEVSIFLLVWISFIGGSLGLKYKSQASVTILVEYVSLSVKRILLIIGHLLMLMFLIFILYYSYKWVLSPSVGFQKSSAILLPMWIPFSAVPIGLTFATVHLLANLLDILREGDAK
ncbi:TRAP transporter small permease [Anaerobacillus alkaliphilus]|uniref:TRAP transporter small permease n=1 Tax=Anaerobacillus alkaliphilus TaxID=1548597 RepID=A0A4Q0VQ45_9BACI|nr:TRAP transporter small permease [Anaerobacillus alkaliphilus]RXI98299.1 TRAP transporter small permease [Anaerobacillus alkaliphilus]